MKNLGDSFKLNTAANECLTS